jgi:hypothetical protein
MLAGERLSVLTGLPALRSLSLADGGIGEDSLAHVGRCSRLTRLELQVGLGGQGEGGGGRGREGGFQHDAAAP